MRLVAPAFVLLTLIACVNTTAVMMDVTAQRAPICSDAVKIYPDTAAIGQPFQRVAMLSSSGSSDWTTATGMINSQRQRAATLGANGVVMGATNEASAGAKVAGAFLGTGTSRTGGAMAVYVPGDTASITQLCDGTKNRRAMTGAN